MQTLSNVLLTILEMATFKITKKTTVAELKKQFSNEVGGVLRVYEGRSEATDGATLVSLGAKEGELECRTSRTVGKFIEAFQSELNLKVKVYTPDNWVAVLDGITLATVKEIPNGSTKAKMEAFLAYQRNEKEAEEVAVSEEVIDDSYNLTPAEIDGKYGYKDKSGKFVVEPKFDMVSWLFREGLAIVEINDKKGFIDKSGKVVIEPKFDKAFDFCEGLAMVKIDGGWGYIDLSGKFVIEPQFDEADDFRDGIAEVEIDGDTFNIDKQGNRVDD